MKNMKYAVLLLICFAVLSACSPESQFEKSITPFSFTDQDGQPFGTDDLKGSIWIADFIFTNCTTVCLPMTAEMASLQERLKEENIEANFVSFTVDPEFDSPEALKAFVTNFTDDLSNWHLLTGYSQDDIQTFAREQFQTIVQKPTTSSQVIHGTNFYLIDHKGIVVNEYNYIDASYVDDIIKDMKKLEKRNRK